MKLKSYFDSPYLRASDVAGREVECTIEKINVEPVKVGNNRPVAYFEELKKGLVVNQTRYDDLVGIFGEDTDDWIGGTVILFTKKVEYNKERVDSIRIKAAAKKTDAPEEDDDDEVGF